MSDSAYTIIFDGGSRGNPGPGYGSYALYAGRKRIVLRLEQGFSSHMTNNEAEYQALAAAMEHLLSIIAESKADPAQYDVQVRGDSLLVILQLSGEWKARDPRMKARRDAILSLAIAFKSITYTHQARSKSFALFHH
jgi:ribonuclease HI